MATTSTWRVSQKKLILLQLYNGSADFVETWYALRCPLAIRCTKVIGGVSSSARVHVSTEHPFSIFFTFFHVFSRFFHAVSLLMKPHQVIDDPVTFSNFHAF